MAAGRPTDYKPEYCKKLIAHMTKGLSFESFAASIDSCKQTLYGWVDKFPEFLDAKRKGESKSLEWWEKAGQEGLWSEITYDANGKPESRKVLNATIWIFNMKNRHKWRDRHDVDVKTEDVSALKKLSMAELKDLVKKNLKEDE